MKRCVVITGLGVLAPNGIGKEKFAEAMFSGKSGISFITLFDKNKSKVKIAGEVASFDPSDYIPLSVIRKTDRFVHLGLAATKLALEDSKLDLNDRRLKSAAVIVGSGQGGLTFHEQTIIEYLESGKKALASAVPKITSNAVSAYIAIEYGITGMNQVISTACSSSSQAIGQAFRNIQQGLCDVALTGGVEAPISPVMMEMYNSMLVLGDSPNGDPTKASRPFDLTRNGFVLSEGAAILVLEELENAKKRRANVYAEIIGFGSNCGAYHMVTPNPSGEDAAEAMEMALEDADVGINEVDYINAHGTSTKQNDLAETNAVKKLFGKQAYKVPISSIKSMIGHTIGAAGAIEAVACCLAIEQKMIPPTINLDHPDTVCDLDYVPHKARSADVKTALSNSFGFGSNNAALIIREVSD